MLDEIKNKKKIANRLSYPASLNSNFVAEKIKKASLDEKNKKIIKPNTVSIARKRIFTEEDTEKNDR